MTSASLRAPSLRPDDVPVGVPTEAAVLAAGLARHRPDAPPTVAAAGHRDLRPGAQVAPEAVPVDAEVVLTPTHVLVLGPGRPGTPGCARCLAIRWQRLQPGVVRTDLETATVRRRRGGSAVTDFLIAAVAAALGPQHPQPPQPPRGGDRPRPASSPIADRDVTAVARGDLSVRSARLLADPLCPACAPAGSDAEAEVMTFVPRPKPEPRTFRLVDPAGFDGLDLTPYVNPDCGVVGTAVRLHLGAPASATAGGGITTRVCTDGLVGLSWSGHTARYATSRLVGVFEGLERYAGAHTRRGGRVVRARYDDVRDRAVDPRDIGVYGPDAYAASDRLTPFAPDRPMPWVTGWSLRDRREVLVPARVVFFAGGGAADNYVYGSSNGCATGSCHEEATLFGLLELLERDAFLLGWYSGAPLPELDLAASSDPAVRLALARARLFGYQLRAYDTRAGIDVPAVAAVAVRCDDGPGSLIFSAGAAPLWSDAVRGALAELLKIAPGMPARVRRHRSRLEAMARDFDRLRVLEDHAELYGLPAMREHARAYLQPRARLAPIPAGPVVADDLLDDLHRLVAVVAGSGCDVVVVDQTTPEQRRAGLRSVCTVAPGLAPLDFGWRRQRVLRLPRAAAEMDALRARAGLPAGRNPAPHPFP